MAPSPLTFKIFERFPNVTYGFSRRVDGSMHRHLEKSNRDTYFRKIHIDPARVVTADQVHGIKVARVFDETAGKMIDGTDGLMTDTKKLYLTATAADCFLLYFYDPTKNAVSIAHAGWRGVLGGIAVNVVGEMMTSFGTKPEDLLVGVSPGIQQCHFEISPKDRKSFARYSDFVSTKDGRVFVDLPSILKIQLVRAMVRTEHIDMSDECTHCNEAEYFSFRRDKPKDVEPMVGYIGLC
ncbi:MAG TPA: peptidoglycan editing factor PgeF [Candidatus Paceibacterota bacterium]